MNKEDHELAKTGLSKYLIWSLEEADDPCVATDIICTLNSVDACAALDKIFPLFAALIIGVLTIRAREKNDPKAQEILTRARELEIQGTKGICHERDEFFKRTGIFIA